MKRSSAGSGRLSFAPLRAQNRASTGGTAGTSGSRSSLGNRQSFGGRRSAIGKQNKNAPAKTQTKRYSSGYGNRHGHERLKDPRPITEKAYKDRSIRELVEFLGEQGYPFPITPRVLQSPSKKDFLQIFEFMIQFILPNYKCTKGHEEEIPRIFKSVLAYPFMISKSSMLTVGTQHTWPHFLAALSWLREQIQHTNCVEAEDLLFPMLHEDFDHEPETKMAFHLNERAYQDFLDGADTYDDYDEQYVQMLLSHSGHGNIEEVVENNKRLTQEKDMMEEMPNPIPRLRESRDSLQLHISKLKAYSDEVDTHIQALRKKETELATQEQAIEEDLQLVLSELSQKQHILNTQKFSQTDVEKIHARRKELHGQIEGFNNQEATVDKDIWQLELAITRLQEGAEAKALSHNNELSFIPVDALHGLNASISQPLQAFSALAVNRLQQVKPALNTVKSVLSDKLHEAKKGKMNEEEGLGQVQEMLSLREKASEQLEAASRRLDDELTAKKESCMQATAQLQEELEAVEGDLKSACQMSLVSSSDLRYECQQLQQQTHQQAEQQSREESTYAEFLVDVVKMVVEHQTLIDNHLQDLQRQKERQTAATIRSVQDEGIVLPDKMQRFLDEHKD